jgi:hypothetical protein
MARSSVLQFRSGVVVSPTLQLPGLFIASYTLIDTDNHSAYQIDDREMFLCNCLALPGWESEIYSKFSTAFGQTLSRSDLDDFIDHMRANNLLEPSEVEGPGWIARALGNSHDNQHVIFRIENPMKLIRPVANVAGRLDVLFRLLAKTMLLIGGPCSFFAILNNFDLFRYDLHSFFSLSQFPMFVLVDLLVFGMGSRMAQGVAHVSSGGKVGNSGIQLSYGFAPHFFIELQNLEHLSRQQQLWVLATSMLVRLSLVVVATYFWLASRQLDTNLKAVALFVLVTNGTSLLLTASPFWKSEGYVWLISFLRLPHLFERSAAVWEMLLFRPSNGLLNLKQRLLFIAIGTLEAIATSLLIIAAISIYSFGFGESLTVVLGAKVTTFILSATLSALVLRNLFSELYRLRAS